MRLWSIHPTYLDAKGLVALWREGLLAQKVLQGKTKGYKHHPQLIRFKNSSNPVGAIATYLSYVVDEADQRGYNFNRTKLVTESFTDLIPVTTGQLTYEFTHLLRKLENRAPDLHIRFKEVTDIKPHPMFTVIEGDVEPWEVI